MKHLVRSLHFGLLIIVFQWHIQKLDNELMCSKHILFFVYTIDMANITFFLYLTANTDSVIQTQYVLMY